VSPRPHAETMQSARKLVIFDCDGTLVDSQHMICAAMQQAYLDHRIECPPRERLLSIVGLSLVEAFERLGEGAQGYPVETLVERYKAAFFAMRAAQTDMEPLFPGVREAIEALAARPDTLLGVATGKSRRGVRMVLGHHGLLAHFATIKTADDAPSKPHPGMVLEAMREAGCLPGDTVVIGDTTYDIEMARAAGARAIGVTWGYHPVAELHAAGAHEVIEEFSSLLPALDRLYSGRAYETATSI
jgi:phosphoglycolate phosphatase